MAGRMPGFAGAGPREPSQRLQLCQDRPGCTFPWSPCRGGPDKQHRVLAFLPLSACRFLLALKPQLKRVARKSGIPRAFQSIPFATVSVCCVCTTGQWLELQRGTVTLRCAKPVVLTTLSEGAARILSLGE